MRGQQHTRVDGSIIRPSLVLLDDPQTRESARSVDQTRKRLELLNGDVLGMAGPGEQISALMTCTKMYEGDLADTVLDREKYPEWDSECTRLVYAFPADEKLWEEYAEIRRSRGKAAATEFYRQRQAAMDDGAEDRLAATVRRQGRRDQRHPARHEPEAEGRPGGLRRRVPERAGAPADQRPGPHRRAGAARRPTATSAARCRRPARS